MPPCPSVHDAGTARLLVILPPSWVPVSQRSANENHTVQCQSRTATSSEAMLAVRFEQGKEASPPCSDDPSPPRLRRDPHLGIESSDLSRTRIYSANHAPGMVPVPRARFEPGFALLSHLLHLVSPFTGSIVVSLVYSVSTPPRL